ncbi:Glucans biosynthesis glucosyltransferase H [Pseudobythopirellula maris]|uniref:Glucans biosynthesis glucosyltransferase H n=1 Tax=Pseudobythopirellula maris TaxID=2527991 RepID=A0A5C5ZKH3_9BACT|nr:glucans biosynthesis glucosyltransferase MdoH [Pseudobythopirellula maris]TWT87648.1 Glucans biosynthesis glucosyltransferase H [Pseudobythopirellula maris]
MHPDHFNQREDTSWRGALTALVAAIIGATAAAIVWRAATPFGATLADYVLAGLMFVLTSWIALWCTLATVGFVRLVLRGPEPTIEPPGADERIARTAVLMPIYNETVAEVIARVEAMRQSLARMGRGGDFDFFLLSDSTNPRRWLEEESLWLRMDRSAALPSVYYRHRRENSRRKVGNLHDFCVRWGKLYDYMLVLDADSLVEGAVMVELARRMDRDPALGILQTPPLPLGDGSILARGQQFVSRLCGPVLAEGLSWICGDGGNYWGHNAIIRTRAFMRHCGLSDLPGAKPLGGEVLSHDFVEAALMGRAGYKVRLATDLTASYETTPSTLPEYAQRDQRWCQGNLQHSRLVVSRGIPLSNRFHFATGVMAYGSSPLWLAFLLVSPLALMATEAAASAWLGLGLFGFVMAMLLLPRFYGIVLACNDTATIRGYGGEERLVASAAFEFLTSVLVAPVMMMLHTLFVVTTLRGETVEWASQDRSAEGVSWRQAWSLHKWHTMAGVLTAAASIYLSTTLAVWLAPIWLGLVLSAPMCVAISSRRLGLRARRWGLLAVPEESEPPAVVAAYERIVKSIEARGSSVDLLGFLSNAQTLEQHCRNLHETEQQAACDSVVAERLERLVASGRLEEATPLEERSALCDPDLLWRLHRKVWAARLKASQAASPILASHFDATSSPLPTHL